MNILVLLLYIHLKKKVYSYNVIARTAGMCLWCL